MVRYLEDTLSPRRIATEIKAENLCRKIANLVSEDRMIFIPIDKSHDSKKEYKARFNKKITVFDYRKSGDGWSTTDNYSLTFFNKENKIIRGLPDISYYEHVGPSMEDYKISGISNLPLLLRLIEFTHSNPKTRCDCHVEDDIRDFTHEKIIRWKISRKILYNKIRLNRYSSQIGKFRISCERQLIKNHIAENPRKFFYILEIKKSGNTVFMDKEKNALFDHCGGIVTGSLCELYEYVEDSMKNQAA